jgi:CheY-like chemotaxis protein
MPMRNILLVDDTAMAREPLSMLLRYEGYNVLAACNGLEALETLRHHPVDLVLLDVMMPKMNGIQLLESLRQQEAWKTLAVIALTGSMDRAHITRLRELGALAVIIKARFKIDQLLSCLKSHLPPIAVAQ